MKKNILDAGSGISFLPYYLKHTYRTDIYCVDYDKNLSLVYDKININESSEIHFSTSDLCKINFESNYFDVIYCISVLEHTHNYEDIIQEFFRILKSGGKLIITFDLSLDGQTEINIKGANNLLNTLTSKFNPEDQPIHKIR